MIWTSLLSAYRVVENLETSIYAVEISIFSIYANKGIWGEVKKIREKMSVMGW
ncbi:hypothetical protein Hanom_Chr12g01071231 [Helianthus anomalus]